MSELFTHLTSEQWTALARIVSDWIDDGFTMPPYESAYYDIFEALGLARAGSVYDTRRSSA